MELIPKTMELKPKQVVNHARERFALHDYYGCIHLLEELVEEGKGFADALNLLGLSYHMTNQPDRALAALERAVELNPRYVEAQLHRGIVLADLGRETEAAEAFAAARSSGEGDGEGEVRGYDGAKLANLHAALGEAYAEAGSLSRAVEQYRRALELGPKFHDLRYRLGRLLLEAGRSLEARDEFERVVAARPGMLDAKASFGLACYLAGDAATARAIWNELLAEHPDDRRARSLLAMLDRGET